MRGHCCTPYDLICPANLAAGRFGRAALPWQCSYPGPVACAHPIFPSAPAIRATMPAQTTPDLTTLVKGLPSLQPTAHIGYL